MVLQVNVTIVIDALLEARRTMAFGYLLSTSPVPHLALVGSKLVRLSLYII